MLYDLVLQKPVPTLFAGDVLLFLPGVLMLAGFLLQPHLEQSQAQRTAGNPGFSAADGVVDLLLRVSGYLLAIRLAQ